jgi:hypothetical protein
VLVHAAPEHDRKVSAEIKSQLDTSFKKVGQIDVATRIQSALAKVTEKRDQPGMSTDEVLRDVEYYFHGLYGAAARDWNHITPALGAPVYNAMKWAAVRCRDLGIPDFERWMRTQPGNPVSEPGGTAWAYRGLRDGFSLDGTQTVGPRPSGHGLTLPALQAATPCNSK